MNVNQNATYNYVCTNQHSHIYNKLYKNNIIVNLNGKQKFGNQQLSFGPTGNTEYNIPVTLFSIK